MAAKKRQRSTWGSIREKAPGVFELRYTVADATGVKVPKSESIRGTRVQADARLAALRVKYEGVGDSSELTVAEYYKGWFEPSLKEPQYSPMTIRGYKSNYKCHILPVFGDRIMTSITPREVQDWINSMTYGAAKHSKATLSAMYGQACGVDMLIDTNVMAMARYRMPRKSVAPGRTVNEGVYTKEQADSILKACRGQFWEPTFILSCFGGCRREEAVGCRPTEDIEVINTDSGPFVVYNIRTCVQRINGEVIIRGTTKNEESIRAAIVPPPYSERLTELIKGNDGWIVGNGSGGPVDPEVMSKAWTRWFQVIPFSYIPWKNLRNSYATIMHAMGYDIETISKLMGHADIATTAKHYDRPDAATLVDILKRRSM